MSKNKQTVAVLGASPKPQRYSNKAVNLLLEHGHHVIPVHPAIAEIGGLTVVASVAEIGMKVDTLTLYVSETLSNPLIGDILALNPGRVIFNPGTENPTLKSALEQQGISAEEACTLVLLNTGQF
ncbi:CoA-binding protein [Pontiella sulfatireligans]|uniref:CoA-binding domain-containing protein n=1 Tax=Pontiella sulfatireligans TaxID=2750658 RepID=A0A6C2UQQ3_9BACT|nr:CoA-binding protein [Pontiella sulfatireligans]VGO22409.1 hypothetical protein SCARR_04492 [Pontiella sulfatireligans]